MSSHRALHFTLVALFGVSLVEACSPSELVGVDGLPQEAERQALGGAGGERETGDGSEMSSGVGAGGSSGGASPQSSHECDLSFQLDHEAHPDEPTVVCCTPLPSDIDFATTGLALLNEEREKNGLAPLALDPDLHSAAVAFALHWAAHDGHTDYDASYLNREKPSCSEGVTSMEWMLMNGKISIQDGTFGPEIVRDWLDDEDFGAAVRSASSTRIGIGAAQGLVVGFLD